MVSEVNIIQCNAITAVSSLESLFCNAVTMIDDSLIYLLTSDCFVHTFYLLTAIFLFYQCFIDDPSDVPSDSPSDQPSFVPSSMPSDIPSGE